MSKGNKDKIKKRKAAGTAGKVEVMMYLKAKEEDLQKKLKEMEELHETDIDSFFNLDEDARDKMKGDWSDKDLKNYEYILERASVLRRAIKILEEEKLADRFSFA